MVSPPSRPLILVIDGWLANAGDAAINVATKLALEREVPGARVVLAAHHRALVGERYPQLELAPPIDSLAGVSWPWTTDEDLAERPVIEALVEEADLVLAAGGGYMLERYQPEGRIRGYEEMLARGKRLVHYAQSIGRFEEPGLRARLGEVLRAAELVLVRDQPSLEIVQEQHRVENAHLTADEGFLYPAPRRVSQPRSLLVTAAVHPWERAGGESELDGDSHLGEIAAALERLLLSGVAYRVTLASTTQGLGGSRWDLEDDSVASNALFSAIAPHLRNRVSVQSGYLSAEEYAVLAARHMAVVSMRMHGAILGATVGTPVLLANASDKALAVSRRTDGGIQSIEGRDDLTRLDEIVAPLLEGPVPVRMRQNAALEELRDLARQNAKLVAEHVSTRL